MNDTPSNWRQSWLYPWLYTYWPRLLVALTVLAFVVLAILLVSKIH